MPSESICLSFVFNHKYEKNIPKLREIYSERFSTIRFLSPFSNWGKEDDVITIHETSVRFQGYFAQAYPHLPSNFDYYAFCADDLYLNPEINENNIIKNLGCADAGYIKYLNPVWEHSFAWHKFNESINFPFHDCIVPYTNLLPDREELIKRYSEMNFEYRNLGAHNFQGVYHRGITFERIVKGIHFLLTNGMKRFVTFPLIEGYSDFIVIPKGSLERFCYLCGVFAAMDLWVDCAVATAMVLSTDTINTENDHEFIGREIWDENELQELIKATNGKIDQIHKGMPENGLYIHPIKLSSWN
jgi:hypothetical protein